MTYERLSKITKGKCGRKIKPFAGCKKNQGGLVRYHLVRVSWDENTKLFYRVVKTMSTKPIKKQKI
jgi:hypothetical protein